jgi:acetyltransferase
VAKLLTGYRDVAPVPQDAIVEVLVRLSELRTELPEIRELDINPLLADASGVLALDSRIVVGLADAGADFAIVPYPRRLDGELVLGDGTKLAVRAIRPDDEIELAAWWGNARARIFACASLDRSRHFLI